MNRWFAVQCQPHRERGAREHLLRQAFEVFLPLRAKTRRHARRIDRVLVPFFPGYLFVRLDLSIDRWRSVNGTFGVVRLLMQGETPAPVPRGVVEALASACDAVGAIVPRIELVEGQRVRLLDGAFAGLVGELDRMSETGRVRVLLEIMSQRTPVFVPRESVVSADSSL
jgi:transcription elongation factor/antiterminator RfaH